MSRSRRRRRRVGLDKRFEGTPLATPIAPSDEQYVRSADGTRIFVRSFGPADAQPIVLAHGWLCSTEYWNPQVNAFADRYRVVTYDQRGHGRSEAGSGVLSPDVLAADFDAVLSATVRDDQRAVIVGHSMGGMTIMAWAGRYPERVRSTVKAALLASTAIDRLIVEANLVRVPSWVPEATLDRFGRTAIGATFPSTKPGKVVQSVVRYVALSPTATADQVAFCARITMNCPPAVRAGWGRVLGALEIGADLDALEVPTTVLVGTTDRLTPPSHSERIAARLESRGHLHSKVELPGVGHMANVEAAADFNAALTDLLSLD